MNSEATEMPCGCRPGYFECPEASRLWALVNSAYQRGCRSGDYRAYDEAKAAYRAHFGRTVTAGERANRA